MINQEIEAIRPFIDKDIIEHFEYIVGDGNSRHYYVNNTALVCTNLQLIRVLREAFSRGFIVEKDILPR